MLQGKHTPGLKKIMHELRVMKTGEEATIMRKAGKMSGRAFTKAMGEDFIDEKELATFLDYNFKMNGCDGSAYVPVVGGGVNALSIHYTNNNELLNDGEMVLVDAGGHYGGYMTDITRTWPNNGKFTDAQRDLYTAVLNVQRECVKLCVEGKNMSLNEIHNFAEKGLQDQLKQIGFNLSGGGIRTLFPHHVGHFVGIDLHDCATYSKDRKLQGGHVVTIEP